MLALVDNQPRLLSLKQALRVYLEHRLEIVRRRSEYDLNRAKERAHILEGLLKAIDRLDEVIALIRKSKSSEAARDGLIKLLDITEVQAQAILDLQLRRLAALETRKIQDEYKEKITLIKQLEALLKDPKKMRVVIAEELALTKQQYADKRRTIIADSFASNNAQDFLVPEEDTWVTLTTDGKLGRTHDNNAPKVAATTKNPPKIILNSSTAQVLYLVTAKGMCATVPVQQLPQVNDPAEGMPFQDLVSLAASENIVAGIALPMNADTGYIFLSTDSAKVKRVRMEDMPGIVSKPFVIMNVASDENLNAAFVTDGKQDVLLVTSQAQSIRFNEDDVRPTGLPSGGMIGIKLAGQRDRVVAALIVQPNQYVWNITDDGIAKISHIDEYPSQGRAGGGVISMRLPNSSRELAAATIGRQDDNIVVLSNKHKPLYMRVGRAANIKRGKAGGDIVMTLKEKETVAQVVIYQPKVVLPEKVE
jgi:DNA gyrase subunit A